MPAKRKSYLRSSFFSFLSVRTDSFRKNVHNRALGFVFAALVKTGVKRINCHHIADCGLWKELPLKIGKKWYDISFEDNSGNIILIEIKVWKPDHGHIQEQVPAH